MMSNKEALDGLIKQNSELEKQLKLLKMSVEASETLSKYAKLSKTEQAKYLKNNKAALIAQLVAEEKALALEKDITKAFLGRAKAEAKHAQAMNARLQDYGSASHKIAKRNNKDLEDMNKELEDSVEHHKTLVEGTEAELASLNKIYGIRTKVNKLERDATVRLDNRRKAEEAMLKGKRAYMGYVKDEAKLAFKTGKTKEFFAANKAMHMDKTAAGGAGYHYDEKSKKFVSGEKGGSSGSILGKLKALTANATTGSGSSGALSMATMAMGPVAGAIIKIGAAIVDQINKADSYQNSRRKAALGYMGGMGSNISGFEEKRIAASHTIRNVGAANWMKEEDAEGLVGSYGKNMNLSNASSGDLSKMLTETNKAHLATGMDNSDIADKVGSAWENTGSVFSDVAKDLQKMADYAKKTGVSTSRFTDKVMASNLSMGIYATSTEYASKVMEKYYQMQGLTTKQQEEALESDRGVGKGMDLDRIVMLTAMDQGVEADKFAKNLLSSTDKTIKELTDRISKAEDPVEKKQLNDKLSLEYGKRQTGMNVLSAGSYLDKASIINRDEGAKAGYGLSAAMGLIEKTSGKGGLYDKFNNYDQTKLQASIAPEVSKTLNEIMASVGSISAGVAGNNAEAISKAKGYGIDASDPDLKNKLFSAIAEERKGLTMGSLDLGKNKNGMTNADGKRAAGMMTTMKDKLDIVKNQMYGNIVDSEVGRATLSATQDIATNTLGIFQWLTGEKDITDTPEAMVADALSKVEDWKSNTSTTNSKEMQFAIEGLNKKFESMEDGAEKDMLGKSIAGIQESLSLDTYKTYSTEHERSGLGWLQNWVPWKLDTGEASDKKQDTLNAKYAPLLKDSSTQTAAPSSSVGNISFNITGDMDTKKTTDAISAIFNKKLNLFVANGSGASGFEAVRIGGV